MKRITLMVLAVVLTWVGSMAQTREKIRYGAGAGLNITSAFEGGITILPGGEMYGLMNIDLGRDGWMAEGRVGLTLNSMRLSNVSDYDGSKFHHYDEDFIRLSLSVPIMLGRHYEVGERTGIFWLLGPTLNYSPLKLCKSNNKGSSWEDYDAYRWWIGASLKIGVELKGCHRIEAALSTNLTTMDFYSLKQCMVGVSYAYMF